uniref:Transmembrane protein 14C n=3 Tax=Paridae TaxID=9153 RepID=A0A8C0TXQ0_CYACU
MPHQIPAPNSQLYHVTPLLDADTASALPLPEHEHTTWSVLSHLQAPGLARASPTPAPRRAGGFPGALQVAGKTPAPPAPQPPAAGSTPPCRLPGFLLGFRAWGFFFLPQKSRKREALGVFGMAVDWLGFGYAALVTSGGIIGYAKAGSVPSLAAGLFFGSLAGLGAYQISQNPNNIWVSLITSGALTAIMGTRFYHSRKFMPAGLIAGVSLLMVGRLALKMLEKPQEK